jgi:predicted nucleic acid-binding protein
MEENRATLNIKNLPDPLCKKLRAHAKRERRSVALEVIHILSQATEGPAPLSRLALKGLGKEVWRGVDAGSLEGVTSALTLLETLLTPCRASNTALAEQYEAHVTRGRGIRMMELDWPLLRAAAQLRASAGVRMPDALQLAAGPATNCTAYLTSDQDLPSISGLRILQPRNYLSHDSAPASPS